MTLVNGVRPLNMTQIILLLERLKDLGLAWLPRHAYVQKAAIWRNISFRAVLVSTALPLSVSLELTCLENRWTDGCL